MVDAGDVYLLKPKGKRKDFYNLRAIVMPYLKSSRVIVLNTPSITYGQGCPVKITGTFLYLSSFYMILLTSLILERYRHRPKKQKGKNSFDSLSFTIPN